MPYIKPGYKARLYPHIQEIARWIVTKAETETGGQDLAWALLRYAGLNILGSCELQINLLAENHIRLCYWMIAVTDGVIMNVKRELKRRKCPQKPDSNLESGFKTLYSRVKGKELGETKYGQTEEPNATESEKPARNLVEGLGGHIENLVEEIMTIVREKPDEKTFMGLCNYSLTTLGPLVVMDVYGKDFNLEWLQILVLFWEEVVEDFYKETAAPYEDIQIELNGNCEVFALIDERLKAATTE